MPQRDAGYRFDLDETDIELDHFVRSREWQTILELLDDAKRDWVAICTDQTSTLEAIRFAQGALAMIEMFIELPARVFRGDDNGRNDTK